MLALLLLGTSLAGAPIKPTQFDAICAACHTVGEGVRVGPDLAGVGIRRTADDLNMWLKDPQAYKPGTIMPKVEMTDAQRAEMVKWLVSLK